MTPKCEELHLSVERWVGFANNEMARLKAKGVKTTQEWDASVAKTEQFSLEAQCGSGLSDETKTLRERVSAFKTVAHAKVSEGYKSVETRFKRQRTGIEAEVEQACVDVDV